MSRGIATFIYICSGLLVALSQLLLKIDAKENKRGIGMKKILNVRVIAAYATLFVTIFMNMFAMRYILYKYTPILATMSYAFVLLLSCFFLGEHISRRQWIGVVLIFAGIVVFNIS